jgi:hypothetical protein
MTRIFVTRKSEITAFMQSYQDNGYTTYRTRLECNCASHNRRSGILVIDPETLVLTSKVIRCRGCVNRKEAGNG